MGCFLLFVKIKVKIVTKEGKKLAVPNNPLIFVAEKRYKDQFQPFYFISMKKLFFPIVAVLLLSGIQQIQAQVDVTVNPIGLLFGDFSIGADFAVSENFSVEAAVGFGTNKISDVKGTNLGLNAVGKYYFNPRNGADRFYGDVFLRYANRNWNYEDNSGFADYKTNRIGLGFGIGYKVVSSGGFVFDIGFGAGRALVDNNVYEDSAGNREEIDWPNIILQGKLGIGYRFGGSK